MSRDFANELLADLEDMDSLALTLVMAEALNKRGEPGPLARPWIATGRKSSRPAVKPEASPDADGVEED